MTQPVLNRTFQVKEEDLKHVFAYLHQRPYAEVADLVNKFALALKEIPSTHQDIPSDANS